MNDAFPSSSNASTVVAQAWIEILDRHSLEQNQPFDEAGGDSLKLMHFVLLLERAVRRNLSLEAFHSGLRPTEMAALLQPEPREAASGQSDLPVLFLFPGLGGHDPQIMKLGLACAAMVRIKRISYPSWKNVIDAPEFNFAALIRFVIAQIMPHLPGSSPLFAGYSFGGIVAFAAAIELARAGYTVRFLGLLDSDALLGAQISAPSSPPKDRPISRRQELRNIIEASRCGDGAEMLAHVVVRRLKGPRWKPAVGLVARIPRSWLPNNFGIYLYRDLQTWYFQPLLRQWESFSEMLPADTQTCLFRTDDHPKTAPLGLGWEDRCRNLTIVPIPGMHLEIFDPPYLPALSREFAREITQILAAESSNW